MDKHKAQTLEFLRYIKYSESGRKYEEIKKFATNMIGKKRFQLLWEYMQVEDLINPDGNENWRLTNRGESDIVRLENDLQVEIVTDHIKERANIQRRRERLISNNGCGKAIGVILALVVAYLVIFHLGKS